jgi:uncharacterized protein (DUF305 family)
MRPEYRLIQAAYLCALLSVAACSSAPRYPADVAPVSVQAGAPGAASRTLSATEIAAAGQPRHVAADVRFMQDMIAHHRQALEMTALVSGRAQSDEVSTLAQRIEVSQDDEIRQMRHWLESRGAALPDAHAHHGHGASHGAAPAHAMPGMLTDAQLAALAAASGAEFDRLFLENMIFHHEGALVMVADLFAAEGAGQETEMFQFASHVDSDQRIEIARMRRMLRVLQ